MGGMGNKLVNEEIDPSSTPREVQRYLWAHTNIIHGHLKDSMPTYTVKYGVFPHGIALLEPRSHLVGMILRDIPIRTVGGRTKALVILSWKPTALDVT